MKKPVAVDPAAQRMALAKATLSAFASLPARVETASRPLTDERVALGRRLYFETKVSKSGTLSCNSCHNLATYGVDNKPTSPGHDGRTGARNSPTVFNAAGHFVQFWDGRAADVEEQAKGPVLNPIEMGMASDKAVMAVLKKDTSYVDAFKKAFPDDKDPMTYDNFGIAIGAYERLLTTPGRWDKYLAGDDKALTDAEKEGFATFVEVGCVSCHTGAYVGGHMYQKAGLVTPWPSDKDTGRFEVTKNEADKFMFKVPSLRNVAKTAPYFHDGSVATLDQAIKVMGKHQLGKELTEAQVKSIATWLEALTGELPKDLITPPMTASK